MHSVNENGKICVNLEDYNYLTDSIRFREKINFLINKLNLPSEIHNFSICMIFRSGQRYYLSNLYLWAIPYRTEGLYRGDIDHDQDMYHGKEFFIQREIKYDLMQTPIIQILESRYNLHTTFAMVRECPDCDFIIEAYNQEEVLDPHKLYTTVKCNFEKFICQFLDGMLPEITSALPELKWLKILSDPEYRKSIITGKDNFSVTSKKLSQREMQCLNLFSQGMMTKEIAKFLNLSPETVTTYNKSIRNKLSCSNITEAVTKAFRFGIL